MQAKRLIRTISYHRRLVDALAWRREGTASKEAPILSLVA